MSWEIHEEPMGGSNSAADDKSRSTVTADRKFNITYLGTSTVRGEDARIALAFSYGVRINASFPGTFWYTCKGISVTQVSPIFFEATANYESLPFNDDEPEDPENEAPEVDFFTVKTDEPIDSDIDGNPLENSAHELYEGLTRPISDLGATIKKKFRVFNPVTFYDFFNTTNSQPFMGFPAGTAKIDNLSASPVIVADELFWEVTVSVVFRKPYFVTDDKAWYLRLRDEGYHVLVDGEPARAKIKGEDAAKPVPLNEDGTRRSVKLAPLFKVFQNLGESNFDDMNLGV